MKTNEEIMFDLIDSLETLAGMAEASQLYDMSHKAEEAIKTAKENMSPETLEKVEEFWNKVYG